MRSGSICRARCSFASSSWGCISIVIDATRVAADVGLRGRTNTILQTCFFAISGVLPRDKAIDQIKQAIRKTYSVKGDDIVAANYRAVDDTLARLFEVHRSGGCNQRMGNATGRAGLRAGVRART